LAYLLWNNDLLTCPCTPHEIRLILASLTHSTLRKVATQALTDLGTYLDPVLFAHVQSTKETDPEADEPVTETALAAQLIKMTLLTVTLPVLRTQYTGRRIGVKFRHHQQQAIVD